MFNIELLKECPDDIIFKILDHNFLAVHDIYNFLFYKSTHDVAQQVLNKRSLIHLTIGKRKNCESVITSSHDYEITKGPYFWHIYYNYANKDLFLSWYDRHKYIQNYVVQIFLDQFQFESLQFLQILKYKKIKIYLNYESDFNHTVRKFTHIIWPMIGEIFDLSNNFVNLILEYESSIDQNLTIDLSNLNQFEFRHYTPTYRSIEFKVNDKLQELKINNISMLPITIKLSSIPLNITQFLCNGPIANLVYLGHFLTKCPNLQKLSISKAHLSNFPDFIDIISPMGLPRLAWLDLSNNEFGNIEDLDLSTIFPNLSTFIMKFEQLKTHRFRFSDITFPDTLTSLILHDKGISKFTNIEGIKFLKYLDLSYNYPQDFEIPQRVSHITTLNLSYNRTILSSIYRFNRRDISNYIFFHVTELHLQGCNITNEDLEHLEADYQHSKHLPKSCVEYLDLSNNKLSNLRSFSGKLFTNLPLKYLDLSFNAFTYLNKDIFPITRQIYPNLSKVNLTGNARLHNITLSNDYPELELMYTPFERTKPTNC
ncbi:uncharacterized protein SPAPADRAFT_49563 [Spathaspora passalidarum NRRL Y-27907]|uniref:F-box domain-containing protein n=1 Tax=Spathaspora passalidarum (strain NRRL Y-27907 / 11-Y1) TaxID=619300 RepID=G3AJ15_SPAPN|nr:uncharacterized protein SPAPADRAFT_49563 [Spathaspora passalidarum NRRL Y-27907]EGW34527.1 hypothetical protein SPAPADRAFT_49563 [Spathaspora passalidarum NRRL Y-27907]